MCGDVWEWNDGVNCRIGSLEIIVVYLKKSPAVNCRIGSLEILPEPADYPAAVNCRIGSLETDFRALCHFLPC